MPSIFDLINFVKVEYTQTDEGLVVPKEVARKREKETSKPDYSGIEPPELTEEEKRGADIEAKLIEETGKRDARFKAQQKPSLGDRLGSASKFVQETGLESSAKQRAEGSQMPQGPLQSNPGGMGTGRASGINRAKIAQKPLGTAARTPSMSTKTRMNKPPKMTAPKMTAPTMAAMEKSKDKDTMNIKKVFGLKKKVTPDPPPPINMEDHIYQTRDMIEQDELPWRLERLVRDHGWSNSPEPTAEDLRDIKEWVARHPEAFRFSDWQEAEEHADSGGLMDYHVGDFLDHYAGKSPDDRQQYNQPDPDSPSGKKDTGLDEREDARQTGWASGRGGKVPERYTSRPIDEVLADDFYAAENKRREIERGELAQPELGEDVPVKGRGQGKMSVKNPWESDYGQSKRPKAQTLADKRAGRGPTSMGPVPVKKGALGDASRKVKEKLQDFGKKPDNLGRSDYGGNKFIGRSDYERFKESNERAVDEGRTSKKTYSPRQAVRHATYGGDLSDAKELVSRPSASTLSGQARTQALGDIHGGVERPTPASSKTKQRLKDAGLEYAPKADLEKANAQKILKMFGLKKARKMEITEEMADKIDSPGLAGETVDADDYYYWLNQKHEAGWKKKFAEEGHTMPERFKNRPIDEVLDDDYWIDEDKRWADKIALEKPEPGEGIPIKGRGLPKKYYSDRPRPSAEGEAPGRTDFLDEKQNTSRTKAQTLAYKRAGRDSKGRDIMNIKKLFGIGISKQEGSESKRQLRRSPEGHLRERYDPTTKYGVGVPPPSEDPQYDL